MKTEKIYFVKRKSTNLNNRFPKPKHIKSVNNKEPIVKEEAYPEPIKPKLDFANSILSQVISKPVKEKTITALVSVKYAPLKVKVGEIIKPSHVIINVNYSDGSSFDITLPNGKDAFIDSIEEYVPGSREKMMLLFSIMKFLKNPFPISTLMTGLLSH